MGDRRVRVAAVNDYELVAAGLAALLGRYPERVVCTDAVVIGEPIRHEVDVALYDTYGRVGIGAEALRALAAMPQIRYVAVFSLLVTEGLVAQGFDAGASGVISKGATGEQIVDAIEGIARGERVVVGASPSHPVDGALSWPGQDDGLTLRQSQALALAAEGLTNREIADALYLSLDTVKGHLSEAFARLGLRNRVEATAYVHRSDGFRRSG
ncbi:MAG: response regulator transcription factor [Acidimicrobiia bacterium]